jgi:hypothetical protein
MAIQGLYQEDRLAALAFLAHGSWHVIKPEDDNPLLSGFDFDTTLDENADYALTDPETKEFVCILDLNSGNKDYDYVQEFRVFMVRPMLPGM